MISEELKQMLVAAAEKHECPEFVANDPVQFPHRYKTKTDIEIAGLLTALLSFGSRRQIIAKADILCRMTGLSPTAYVRQRKFEADFRNGDAGSFYRMLSYDDFRGYFEKLYAAYRDYESLEDCVERFPGTPMQKMCAFMGVSDKSPQKKINMFLRWMVRDCSAVDFGIWRGMSKSDLVIPLDTHVSHMAMTFGITDRESYSLSAAKAITSALAEIFPGDPVRGDFALFGVGVEMKRP